MRVFNFAAGPAALPLEVLEQVRGELTDWQGSGASVMEVSHRSKPFLAVAREAERLPRELLAVPESYKVLFVQGGATGQFAAVPLNLARADSAVDYLNTGHWSKKAIGEARRLAGKVSIVADEGASRYTTVPAAGTPAVWDYKGIAEAGSMLNPPPTFAWYCAGLVFRWLRAQGGLGAVAARNRAKAELLYQAIDGSGFYSNPVARECRSWMNVPFTLATPSLDETFVAEARRAGLANLEGHRSVGGMRASLYNAMPLEGVQALVAFMKEFERRHG